MFDVNNYNLIEEAANRYNAFQNLMPYRVHNILLVSSIYDSFILSEDGELSELMLSEYLDLNLRHAPGVKHVSFGAKALEMIRSDQRFNLIITTMHLGDMDALEFARKVKEANFDIPVILLVYNIRELGELEKVDYQPWIERIFLWQGDFQILLAIVKYVEDRLNVENDTQTIGVQVIILIENNIHFYSSYLPIIYEEVMKQSQSLISEGVNRAHKLLRMRARPKILLSTSFEEAWSYYNRYEEYILGIISDIEFPKNGVMNPEAGANFTRLVKDRRSDIPILLQSSKPENAAVAENLKAAFVLKNSPVLLHEVRNFMLENFGFGDFVFYLPDLTEVGRAKDLKSLAEVLKIVPAESIRYHGERNHFSNWLKARTEFLLAEKLKPIKVTDYATIEDVRHYLINTLNDFMHSRQQGVIIDFNPELFDTVDGFARIGGGSLGGKARGLAFLRALVDNYDLRRHFEGVNISVPSTVVIGTEVFDQFVDKNNLGDFALGSFSDEEILQRFLQGKFPRKIVKVLKSYLELVNYPLAVRSSSLLEDSQYQPFAGVYETYMLPNCHENINLRLSNLIRGIKRVYASTFSSRAKTYFKGTPYRLEEEKMAVIIQKLVGSRHGNRFYPAFAGVAKSHSYYSTPPVKSTDGLAIVALGFGKTVMEGGAALSFCPRYPRNLIQFSSSKDFLQYSQREFFGLELQEDEGLLEADSSMSLKLYPLEAAEQDGVLGLVGSVYSPDNDAVYDGISRSGIRLVTFAPILKHRLFPLTEIVQLVIKVGYFGMSLPIEIEFAVDASLVPDKPKDFSLLQMRPLVMSAQIDDLQFDEYQDKQLLCRSNQVLGNGVINDLRHIVMVDVDKFKRSESKKVAREVAAFNSKLEAMDERYLLIGVGRWGSADPWLGIPVTWEQISAARVIVESGFKDFKVVPSQGSHFFQNIISMMIGYFTVNPDSGEGYLDWDWLRALPSAAEGEYTRLIKLEQSMEVKMNGFKNTGIIVKPV